MEKIEILNHVLLQQEEDLIEAFERCTSKLGIDLGWHYLLDLAWIASHLGNPEGKVILDAGAGTGVLQWWLADRGAKVISVDRASRRDLSLRFRMLYHARGLQSEDFYGWRELLVRRFRDHTTGYASRLYAGTRTALSGFLHPFWPKAPGEVIMHHGDLAKLEALESGSIDHIVSVSALEHNEPDQLNNIVPELWRLLKPGGKLLATLAAARDKDWYHAPSSGWCYTEQSLQRLFHLSSASSSNFDQFDELFESLRKSDWLRERLSPHYSKSGENGMPWGIWDPQYQPVGILKVKSVNRE